MLSRGGLPEAPCTKCGQRVRGLAWSDLCPDCAAEVGRRAAKVGQWAGLAAAVLAAVYVILHLPADLAARYYGALAVVVTYILVRRIVQRVMVEVLK